MTLASAGSRWLRAIAAMAWSRLLHSTTSVQRDCRVSRKLCRDRKPGCVAAQAPRAFMASVWRGSVTLGKNAKWTISKQVWVVAIAVSMELKESPCSLR